MKNYKITAEAFIGWIRIARPGSILGPQQFYLIEQEQYYLRSGGNMSDTKNKLQMSPQDKHKSKHGEAHQGNYLIQAKERNSETKNRKGQSSQSPQAYSRSLR